MDLVDGQLRTKTLSAVPELKQATSANEGVVVARFATFDVVDFDGHVLRPKSIGKQKAYAGRWDHGGGLPLGDSMTYEEKDGAYAEITYDLEDPDAARLYRFLTRRAERKLPVEWSWGYYVEKGRPLPEDDPLFDAEADGLLYELQRTDVVTVDPVGRGAGIDTGTIETKACGHECQARKHAKHAPAPDSAVASGDITVELYADTSGIDSALDRVEARLDALRVKAQALGIGAPVSLSAGAPTPGTDTTTASTATTVDVDTPPYKADELVAAVQDAIETKGQSLADMVRELRDERELTNDALAEATGLSVASVGQILGGTLIPAAGSLAALADVLGASLSSLAAAAEADTAAAVEEQAEPEPETEPEPEPEEALVQAALEAPETKADPPNVPDLLADIEQILAEGDEPSASEALVTEIDEILAEIQPA